MVEIGFRNRSYTSQYAMNWFQKPAESVSTSDFTLEACLLAIFRDFRLGHCFRNWQNFTVAKIMVLCELKRVAIFWCAGNQYRDCTRVGLERANGLWYYCIIPYVLFRIDISTAAI